ncbi:uncharacterized protein LOC143916851 [Arctopsyche grandis]|uniref:uncharacterized protein LOC143916851 n=1 Tax=Arctopsyche grandis TaxID=121162 RepID=UPI00406D735D
MKFENEQVNQTEHPQPSGSWLPREFNEIQDRLLVFVEYFVERLETQLDILLRLLEGKENDSKKKFEKYSSTAGKTTNEILSGAMIYLLGPAYSVPAKLVGILAEKSTAALADYFNEKYQKKEAVKLSELVFAFKDYKAALRKFFVEIAVNIFRSFEIQFMGFLNPRKAMMKAAYTAADRILSCEKNTDLIKMAPEGICDITNKLPYIGIRFPRIMGSKVKLDNGEWNIADMYEETGISIKKSDSEDDYEYYTKNGKSSDEFGYRRPFYKEIESTLKITHRLVKKNTSYFLKFKYDIGFDYEKQIDVILNKINDEDESLSEERLKKCFNYMNKDLLDNIQLLMSEDLMTDEESKNLKCLYDMIKNVSVEVLSQLSAISEKTTEILTVVKTIDKKLNNKCRNVSPKKPFRFGLIHPVKAFSGREDMLKEIHLMLSNNINNMTVISQMASVTGLGGIGKTELSRKYAMEYSNFYQNIAFINSENRENIIKDFRELADQLYIPIFEPEYKYRQDKDIFKIIHEIYTLFENDQQTLLIFDNVNTYNDIKDFFPKSSISNKPFILITSRCQDWNVEDEGKIEKISLKEFDHDDAIKYVKAAVEMECENEDVEKLVQLLHFFPLALKQATGYVNQKNTNKEKDHFKIRDYLDLYHEKQQQLFNKDQDKDKEKEKDRYRETVLTTWSVTMKKIKENDDCGMLAMQLFNFMAYLSPDSIDVYTIFSNLEKNNVGLSNFFIIYIYIIYCRVYRTSL